jgi:hypothetical protein
MFFADMVNTTGAESKPTGRAVDREVNNSYGRSDKISAELGARIPVH